MMWQDLVFMVGSSLSIFFLAPTLRDSSARVPLGTSLPSMVIGGAYAFTFATMGMTFSAAGAFASGTMWSLIAICRSPGVQAPGLTRREEVVLFACDALRWGSGRVRRSRSPIDDYVRSDGSATMGDYPSRGGSRDRAHAAD